MTQPEAERIENQPSDEPPERPDDGDDDVDDAINRYLEEQQKH